MTEKMNNSERIYTLNEIASERGFDAPEIIAELKKLLCEYGTGNIGLAQINTVVGDIKYNALKVIKYLRYAEEIGLDLVAFPEVTLLGYQIEDVLIRHPMVVDENIKWLKEIAKLTDKTRAVIGFVERNPLHEGRRYYNSVAVLGNGKIEGIIRKSLMPNYSEFYDHRYFEASPVVGSQPVETLCNLETPVECDSCNDINGLRYGISICEDCWNNKDFFDPHLYHIDPVAELAKENPDIVLPGNSKLDQRFRQKNARKQH